MSTVAILVRYTIVKIRNPFCSVAMWKHHYWYKIPSCWIDHNAGSTKRHDPWAPQSSPKECNQIGVHKTPYCTSLYS